MTEYAPICQCNIAWRIIHDEETNTLTFRTIKGVEIPIYSLVHVSNHLGRAIEAIDKCNTCAGHPEDCVFL